MKKKKHGNIAIFVPHAGCPHQCSFCDQRKISATLTIPTKEQIQQICEAAVHHPHRAETLEIAFFGGSFTAIPEQQQIALLEAVQPFLADGQANGIRISTRPDCITSSILQRLKQYHVTAIELGAQSMENTVLKKNHRGHTAEDVHRAAAAITEAGFSLGLQMMIGLDGSTITTEYATLHQLLALHPDTLRLYPLVVLKGTELAERVEKNQFSLYPMEQVLSFCADALCMCHAAGVRVIRCGLHAEEVLQTEAIAGFYHPAFREQVESLLCLRCLKAYIQANAHVDKLCVQVPCGWSSRVAGHHSSNRAACADNGVQLHIKERLDLPQGQLQIGEDIYHVFQITGITGL